MTARPRGRSLRTRLLLFVTATLVAVCAAMAGTMALFQRSYLMGELDDRVGDEVARGLGGAELSANDRASLSFLNENGHPAGTLAARLDAHGEVVSAAVVRQEAPPRNLTADQRAALRGIATDGSEHTRTVPGLGVYRIAAARSGDVRVLAGLPMADVRDTIGALVAAEAAVAAAGLAVAGVVCAVVIRRQLRPLGRVAATATAVTRVPLDQGEVTGLTRVPVRDTDCGSEAGQVAAALNRMIDHVETSLAERQRSEERMRRFLADAGHELRTPLASIAGYAELMNRGTDRVEPVLAWRTVSAESARMTGLVEDLLLLTRLDGGRPLEQAEVDLAAVAAEAVWQARASDDGHHWQLALHLDHAPALVTGDRARLHQALANLLANARMHTPDGTTVLVEVEATGERCVVRVRDDGPGIAPELLPTVFEPFTRAGSSRTRPPGTNGGSGLGLAVVRAVVSAHGGRIDAESTPGRTEFTAQLPLLADPFTVESSSGTHAVH